MFVANINFVKSMVIALHLYPDCAHLLFCCSTISYLCICITVAYLKGHCTEKMKVSNMIQCVGIKLVKHCNILFHHLPT